MSEGDLICCFCSFESIEQKTVDRLGAGNIEPYIQNEGGLQCWICNSFACLDCLIEILYVFPKTIRREDKWCRIVRRFVRGGYYPNRFVGHCCELKVAQKKAGLNKIILPRETRFDGHLYLPEFSLILDSPFDCVDVHGLGGNEHLPAVWHCVFAHKAAEVYEAVNLLPDGNNVRWLDAGSFHKIEITLPYGGNSKLMLNVRVRSAAQTTEFNEEKAGTNDPLPDEIKHCLVIKSDDRPPGVDIDIITGRFDIHPDQDSLLLFRIYNFKERVKQHGSKWPTNVQVQALYKICLEKLCKRGGYEAKRSGGSSGLPRLDHDLFSFIKLPGSFPRKGRGVKFIAHGRVWLCAYIRVLPRKGKYPGAKFPYSPPRRGGQFKVSSNLLNSFPFLYDFSETKIIAALVLDTLNRELTMVPIQQSAVRYELLVINKSIQDAIAAAANSDFYVPPENLPRKERREWQSGTRERFRRLVIQKFVSHSQHTLVQHPVGFHCDVFRQGKECLENKICFVVHGQHHSDPMGRGGMGNKTFVVVFLDWAD